MFSPPSRSARSRGITLVELIVTSALVVIITGILLGILIETRRNVLRAERRVAMENQARLITDQVCVYLQNAVRPASLDAPAVTSTTLTFANDQCALISTKNYDGKDFYLTTIRTVQNPDKKTSRVELATTVLDPALTKSAREERKPLGLEQKEFSCSIQFEYAATLDEAMDLKPFQKDLNSGEYPGVVRVRVHVEPLLKSADPGAGKQQYELVTAVRML